MNCSQCGAEIVSSEQKCSQCNSIALSEESYSPDYDPNESDRDHLVTLLISFFGGGFGIDRFYLGYTVLGMLKFFSIGGLGIWWLIDLGLIAFNRLPDSDGKPLRNYTFRSTDRSNIHPGNR